MKKFIFRSFLLSALCIFIYFVSNFDIFYRLLNYFNLSFYSYNNNSDIVDDYILKITFIDVGHGDAILIESIDNQSSPHFALIDTGSPQYSQKVLKTLNQNHVKNLDFILISHTHSDHCGAIVPIIDHFHTKTILLPNFFKIKNSLIKNSHIRNSIKNNNISIKSVKPNQKFFLANSFLNILYPISPHKTKLPKNLNDSSIVASLNYHNFKLLLTGDASKKLENAIINNFNPSILNCDIIKLPHHGSNSSSSLPFLKAVSPKFAIVSCYSDPQNVYPHPDVILRLKKLGIIYYDTFKHGDIIVFVNDKYYKIFLSH